MKIKVKRDNDGFYNLYVNRHLEVRDTYTVVTQIVAGLKGEPRYFFPETEEIVQAILEKTEGDWNEKGK